MRTRGAEEGRGFGVSVRVCVCVTPSAPGLRVPAAGSGGPQQQDQAGDASPSAPDPSIGKQLFWMTELANNSSFGFPSLPGPLRGRWRRTRGAGEAGRKKREEQIGKKKVLERKLEKKKSPKLLGSFPPFSS